MLCTRYCFCPAQQQATEPSVYTALLVNFGPLGWPLGSQMVELGCQDTDWVGGNDKEVLDAILLREGLILLIILKKSQNLMKSARILLTIL